VVLAFGIPILLVGRSFLKGILALCLV